MTEDDWKKLVDKEIKDCNEARIRLEEHDKQKQKELKDAKIERMELYDHKNNIYKKLTIMEAEKKFLPYIAMIISIIAGISTIAFILWRVAEK